MAVRISTPNIITLLRLPLLFVVAALLYTPGAIGPFMAVALLPVLYVMDWLDGYVARHKDQVTDLGSVLDIAIDRVVENVLWIVFVGLGKVPVWVAVVFITRSFVVDGLRSYALAKGHSAFGMMRSPLGRFLVVGRFMRGLYGLVKGLAFGALSLGLGVAALGDEAVAAHQWVFAAQWLLVYFSVILCIVRGVPVLWDIRGILDEPPITRS